MGSEQRISSHRAAGRWKDDATACAIVVFQCQDGPTPAHRPHAHWLVRAIGGPCSLHGRRPRAPDPTFNVLPGFSLVKSRGLLLTTFPPSTSRCFSSPPSLRCSHFLLLDVLVRATAEPLSSPLFSTTSASPLSVAQSVCTGATSTIEVVAPLGFLHSFRQRDGYNRGRGQGPPGQA